MNVTITRHGWLDRTSPRNRARFWKDHRDIHGDVNVRVQGMHWDR